MSIESTVNFFTSLGTEDIINISSLLVYLGFLFSLGIIFSKYNTNVSDYVRGGAKAKWWLIGASNAIAMISALTFTGNASVAFDAGPTIFSIYAANILAFFIGYVFLAAVLRQTRAYTVLDIVRARFGVEAEQFNVYVGLVVTPIASAIQLWAMANFTSTAFGLPLIPTIIVIGVVVTLYSTTGGRWAVLATDFIQNLLVFGITLIVAILALVKIGGIGSFLSFFSDPRFATDFQWFNTPGDFSNDKFTLKWAVILFFMTIQYQLSITSADRYLSAKDGKEASRSALFSMVLILFGTMIWFIPPMVSRFLFEDEVLAMNISNPSEGAYTYIAKELLPNGMMGILIAGMFAATMSNMDKGLNGLTGIIIRNLIPSLLRTLKKPQIPDKYQIPVCMTITPLLGVIIIIYSILFASTPDLKLFEAFFHFGSYIGIPLGFPFLAGLWIRKLPGWSYFLIMGFGLAPSLYSVVDEHLFGNPWTYDERGLWVMAFGVIGTLVARLLFTKTTTPKFKKQIDELFIDMKTPIDFDNEVGGDVDENQAYLIGKTTIIIGISMLFLLFVPNEFWGRLSITGISLFFFAIGSLLIWGSRVEKRKKAKAISEEKL